MNKFNLYGPTRASIVLLFYRICHFLVLECLVLLFGLVLYVTLASFFVSCLVVSSVPFLHSSSMPLLHSRPHPGIRPVRDNIVCD